LEEDDMGSLPFTIEEFLQVIENYNMSIWPMQIVAYGILLFAARRVPWYLFVIPLVWSLIATQAAISLTIREDFALPVVGVFGTVMMILKNRMLSRRPII
jgi:hypothetical protein